MANLVPIRFGDIVLQIETAAGSGTFETLCGITGVSRSFNINTQAEEDIDCEDPDAAAFESATKVSIGEEISFTGQTDPEASDLIEDLAYEEEPRLIRLVFNKAPKVGYRQGPAILTAGGDGWEKRQRGSMSGTFKFTERPTWTAT